MEENKKCWSKKEERSFISKYKKHRLLWDSKDLNYRNSIEKRRVQNKLAGDFNTTVPEIIKKIKILRTQFFYERKRMMKTKNQNGCKNGYVSKWEHYRALKFILCQDHSDDDSLPRHFRPKMNETTEVHGVRAVMKEFINIYRNEPCLWQIKHKEYHNRAKKKTAYNKLIEQYQKIEPNANREIVVKKLNALRTNYRKEKKKVADSTRSRAGDVYIPTLWFYDLLNFLDNDQGMRRFSLSDIDENESLQPPPCKRHFRAKMNKTTEVRGVRAIMKEFINIYRNEPCLWQIKNKEYHNRDKKKSAYNKLIELYRKIEPNANREIVVKKLNALRTNYRKEKKKVEDSTRSGAGDVYIPTLWYYDLLNFLDNDQGVRRFSLSDIDEKESLQKTESALYLHDIHGNSSESDCSSGQTSSRARPPKRKTTDLETLWLSDEEEKCEYQDEYQMFGNYVASELRSMHLEENIGELKQLIQQQIIKWTEKDDKEYYSS